MYVQIKKLFDTVAPWYFYNSETKNVVNQDTARVLTPMKTGSVMVRGPKNEYVLLQKDDLAAIHVWAIRLGRGE